MNNTIILKIKDKEYTYNQGTTLLEISKDFQDDFKYEIILAKINNEFEELTTPVTKSGTVEFFDLTTRDANRIYLNGLIFLTAHAYKKLTKKGIKVNHSLDKGLLIETEDKITEEIIKELTNMMKSLSEQDIPIQKLNVARMNAIEYFKSVNEIEKVKNMKYNTNTFITLYKLEDSYDYLYTKMPVTTSLLKHFELNYLNEHAFILRFPTIYKNDFIKPYEHRENIYNLFKTSRQWAKTMDLEYAVDLNERVSNSKINEIIRIDETKKNSEILEIATEICKQEEKQIVLIAGPSSSGKTTTTNKLALSLKSCGKNPCLISMDDYFKDRKDTPLDSKGEPDFECLDAVDLNLFDETIAKLLNEEEVIVPTYNFLTGEKEFKNTMKISKNDILLIEGIHALNPEILKNIPKEKKSTIYLSALTELNIDKHTRISTTDNRLLRRIVRDNRTRGYKVENTLKAWSKVRAGEEKHIFPYQDTADFTLNTAMIYEIGVLKIYAEPLLYSVDISSPYYGDAKRLINFLRVFLPISPEEIPIDSILREFIGGGCFKI